MYIYIYMHSCLRVFVGKDSGALDRGTPAGSLSDCWSRALDRCNAIGRNLGGPQMRVAQNGRVVYAGAPPKKKKKVKFPWFSIESKKRGDTLNDSNNDTRKWW